MSTVLASLALAIAPSARAGEELAADANSPASAPPGRWIEPATRPKIEREARACSARVPVCVHARRSAGASRVASAMLDVLAATERAWETLTGALELPPPDVSPETLAYDVFFLEDLAESAETRLEARDVRSRVDRGRAFTVVDPRVRAGCVLDGLMAREIARAILVRVAPATDEGTARAQATYLAHLVAPCALAFAADETSMFQAHPDRAVCDARASGSPAALAVPGADEDTRARRDRAPLLYAAGAALFWSRIDWAYGRQPGALVTAAWALSPTMTDVGASRFVNEPDAFDVLRVTFKNALSTGSTLADLLLDVAVARAFMGASDDGLHAPETRTLGDAARVELDWDLPWPTTPKRVAPRAPAAPTGASYIQIRRAGAPPGSRLRVEIAWEEHALFRWAFVKVDARGRELGRVPIAARERATDAQMSLVDLDATDRILLVGVNAGDPTYPFDPDDEIWEPHGWLVTVAAE